MGVMVKRGCLRTDASPSGPYLPGRESATSFVCISTQCNIDEDSKVEFSSILES